MKPNRKWLYWTGGILVFLVLLNIGINLWIKHSLPQIIRERNDTAYNFEYGNIGFSLLNSSVYVENVNISPKKDFPEKVPVDFTANVKEIRVVGVNFIKLLTKKDLSAYSIKIKKPSVVYFRPEVPDTTRSRSKLGNVIHVGNFQIQNGSFKMISSDRKTLLSNIDYLDIELGGVNLSQRTLEKNIPFTYSDFELFSSKIFFQVNPAQQIKAKSLKVNDNLFILNDFRLNSITKTENLNPENLSYRLLPDIKAPTVSFTGMDWGFDKTDEFYFTANILKFDSVDINIRNTKETSGRNRDSLGNLVPFKLNINKILVGQSRLKITNSLDARNVNIQIEDIRNIPGEKLTVKSVYLKHPDITTFSGKSNSPQSPKRKTRFIDHIAVGSFRLDSATYRLNERATNRNLLKVNNVNFTTENVEMTPETFPEKIPVTYQNARFTAASLEYNPDKIYTLSSSEITFDNGDFNLKEFKMTPKLSRAQFVRQLKKEKDLYTLSAQQVAVKKIDFGFQGDDIYFKTPEVEIQTAYANIYRSKLPPDDPKKKKLYSEMLRELPFILEVKHLDLKNSKVEYEEETESSKGAGKLTFSNFNADIDNIYSGRQKTRVPDVVANIKTNFMNDSRLTAVWTFNPMNRAEAFNISGNIYSFNAAKMTPFIKPYVHFTAEGDIQEVRFNFNGNDINATGDFGIKYKGLKVTVYNEKNNKERKLISAVGNVLVKTKTNDEFKKTRIDTVTRNQQRSFYNFFWHCVQQGLKQTLLVI